MSERSADDGEMERERTQPSPAVTPEAGATPTQGRRVPHARLELDLDAPVERRPARPEWKRAGGGAGSSQKAAFLSLRAGRASTPQETREHAHQAPKEAPEEWRPRRGVPEGQRLPHTSAQWPQVRAVLLDVQRARHDGADAAALLAGVVRKVLILQWLGAGATVAAAAARAARVPRGGLAAVFGGSSSSSSSSSTSSTSSSSTSSSSSSTSSSTSNGSNNAVAAAARADALRLVRRVCRLAAGAETLFPAGVVPCLAPRAHATVVLTRVQCAALLCHALLGTFGLVGADFALLAHMAPARAPSAVLCGVAHYLRRVLARGDPLAAATATVAFTRGPAPSEPPDPSVPWDVAASTTSEAGAGAEEAGEMSLPLTELDATAETCVALAPPDHHRVVFAATERPGANLLAPCPSFDAPPELAGRAAAAAAVTAVTSTAGEGEGGTVATEADALLGVVAPELLVLGLVVRAGLANGEALAVDGAARVGRVRRARAGYAWAGAHGDAGVARSGATGTLLSRAVVLDTHVFAALHQYERYFVDRELRKARAGLALQPAEAACDAAGARRRADTPGTRAPAACGTWGAGVLGTDTDLRVLLLWLAASAARRPRLLLCADGDPAFVRAARAVRDAAHAHALSTVAQLYARTLQYCRAKRHFLATRALAATAAAVPASPEPSSAPSAAADSAADSSPLPPSPPPQPQPQSSTSRLSFPEFLERVTQMEANHQEFDPNRFE